MQNFLKKSWQGSKYCCEINIFGSMLVSDFILPVPFLHLMLPPIFLQNQKSPDMSSLPLALLTFRHMHFSVVLSKNYLVTFKSSSLPCSLEPSFLCLLHACHMKHFPILFCTWSFCTGSYSVVNSHTSGSSIQKHGFLNLICLLSKTSWNNS